MKYSGVFRVCLRSFVICLILLVVELNSLAQKNSWQPSYSKNNTLAISKIEFSPDGGYIATGTDDGNLKLWDIQTQREIFDFQAHKETITDIVFSENSLLTSSEDGFVKLWDIETRDLLKSIFCFQNGVSEIHLSPDAPFMMFVFPSYDRPEQKGVWNIETGNKVGNLSEFQVIGDFYFGQTPYSSIAETINGVELIDLTGSEPNSLLSEKRYSFTKEVSISPDRSKLLIIDKYFPHSTWKSSFSDFWNIDEDSLTSDYVLISDYSRDSKLRSLEKRWTDTKVVAHKDSLEELMVVNKHYPIREIDLNTFETRELNINKIYESGPISYDNKMLITYDENGTTKLWNLENESLIFEFPDHGGKTDSYVGRRISSNAIFSPNNRYILIYSKNKGGEIWEIPTLTKVIDVEEAADEQFEENYYLSELNSIDEAVFDQGGEKLAISSYNRLFLLDMNSFEFQKFGSMTPKMNSVLMSPSGEWLMASTGSMKSYLWNLYDLSYIETNVLINSGIQSAVFSPKKDVLAINSGADPPYLWDLETMEKKSLSGHSNIVYHLAFDSAGKRFLTTSWDGSAKVWDVASGGIVTTFSGHKGKVLYGEFSQDGELVVTTSDDGSIKLWEVKTGEILLNIQGDYSFAHINRTNKSLIALDQQRIPSIWDIKSGQKIREFKGHEDAVTQAIFHPTQNSILTVSRDKTLKEWDISTGKLLKDLQAHNDYISDVRLSPDKEYFVTNSYDATTKVWDINSLKLLHTLKGHTSMVENVSFSKNGKDIITSSMDGKAIFWDAKTGKQRVVLHNMEDRSYDPPFDKRPEFLWLEKSNNYYYTSTTAAKNLYFSKGQRTISFDQLDVRYNRPDKLLDALESEDTTLINAYKEAYHLRLKRLGVDTTIFRKEFMVPKSNILNADQIDFIQTNDLLKIDLNLKDSVSKLGYLDIRVNGVPIYGSGGIDLDRLSINEFDTTLIIPLSVGRNQIESFAVNNLGIKSQPGSVTVEYTPQKPPKQKVYFIGLGIDKFKEASNNLEYSVKDIKDLAHAFKKKYGDEVEIDTLLNQSISEEKLKRIKKKLLETSINDKVIVAYSGHGLLSTEMKYFLSTYKTSFENPKKGSLPYQELENLLDGIPARQKLLLVDACHSGEVDKDYIEKVETTLSNNQELVRGSRRGVTDPNKSSLSMKNTFELMQEFFVNVSNDIGATVISAAAGDQFAIEKDGNGVFTSAILNYMKRKKSFTVNELKYFISWKVESMTKGLQQPTYRVENLIYDWVVWQ